MIDSAKDELGFILWYYFSHKHSLNDLEEKKTAILDFFAYVRENVEQLWEQLEFVGKASPILEISAQTLEYDFKKYLKSGLQHPGSHLVSVMRRRNDQNKALAVQIKKIPKVEKDILAVLLYFPDYWEKEFLLDQINWSSQEMYLLFNFFRDRLKSGEIWQWANLNEVISLLPGELASVLSEIIFEFDYVMEVQKDKKEERDYSLYFKKMILQNKLNEIETKISEVQKLLDSEEKSEGGSIEELTSEFQTLILEKKKVVDSFTK